MCVIAAKYLESCKSFVAVKNRDRNYKPTISIRQSFRGDVESLYILDSVTKYSEGTNEFGTSIINSATSVKNDESAAALARRYEKKKEKSTGEYMAPDGVIIRRALIQKNIKDSIQVLIDTRLV